MMMKIQSLTLFGSNRLKTFIKASPLFFTTILLGLIVQHAEAKVLVVECVDNTMIQISELDSNSSFGYLFGDLIQVRLSHSQNEKSGIYQLPAAYTASFSGYWVHNPPLKPSFSLFLLGKPNIWYLKFQDQKPLMCDRFVD